MLSNPRPDSEDGRDRLTPEHLAEHRSLIERILVVAATVLLILATVCLGIAFLRARG